MSNLRFVLAAAALFAFAFAGISFGMSSSMSLNMPFSMPWASKGFPDSATHTAQPSSETRVPTFGERVKQIDRKNSHAEIPKGDNDAGRNRLRQTAIQAANAYAHAPCDQATKAAFVVAASTYLRAASGNGAERTFSTPMDGRVREVITATIDAGGLSGNDFPAGLWTAPATKSRGGSAALCANSAALRRP